MDINDELNRLYECAENYDSDLLEKYWAVVGKIRESDPSKEVIDWLDIAQAASVGCYTLQELSWEVKAFCEQFPKNGN